MGVIEVLAWIILAVVGGVFAFLLALGILFTSSYILVFSIPIFIFIGGVHLYGAGYPALGSLVSLIGILVGLGLYGPIFEGAGEEDGSHISGRFFPDD